MNGTIMVTGAGGFIGSHLVERIAKEPVNGIKAFVHYNSRNSWGWLENSPILKDIEVFSGDIRDYDSVHRCMEGCDTIFHLGALIGIPYSYVSPAAYLRVNIEGTYNVIQSARERGCKQVLVTSTSETYGSAQTDAISENHPQAAQSPYAATKIAADQLALSYYRSFGLPVKIVRPFNTFGPRQSARAIIPAAITQLLQGKNKILAGNLEPTRDLTFVLDTVEGFVEIAKCDGLVGEVTNIGANKEISIKDLILLIGRIMGQTVEFEIDSLRVRADKSEVQRLNCDNRKILAATSWQPKYTLEEGLKQTVEWLKINAGIYKAGIYNV